MTKIEQFFDRLTIRDVKLHPNYIVVSSNSELQKIIDLDTDWVRLLLVIFVLFLICFIQ